MQLTLEEIMKGESKNLEFKAELPEESSKYVKTVIAFANTQGGKLIIGVDDTTRQVIGVDSDNVFRLIDRIANAVSDSCEPQIVPDIEPQTVDGRTVIVVNVAPGPNRPYYLRSRGKIGGTYIRVAGTSRPAQPDKVKELEMEGQHVYWDELSCIGFEATETRIRQLCADIERYREKAGLPAQTVTREKLVNLGLLRETADGLIASNAFALLTSTHFPFSKTQCAVFRGTTRNVFLDKREFDGPVHKQIEEAVAFVLRNIRLGATIEGLLRRETYELPIEAIREMIINAHCHRDLTAESCVQVAVYDDRLEVTSPGGLYNGLTYEDIMNGHTRQRNRTLAETFHQMRLIEAWGTGLQRIKDSAAAYDLPAPRFEEFDNMFRVSLYRRHPISEDRSNIGETSEKHRRNDGDNGINATQKRILELLEVQPEMTAAELAAEVGITRRNIESNIRKLKEKGLLIRHGVSKGGYWEVIHG